MRTLVRVRLVQWYHFEDETIDVRGNCLFLGDNGSGKSTILDAIQLALVADLGEMKLNQAANEKGKRTLYGYVRWKLGHEDELRPGALSFNRSSATAYVLLEFDDPDDPSAHFVAGVACEATEADGEVTRRHFVVQGAGTEDMSAVRAAGSVNAGTNGGGERQVRPWKEFRAWLRDAYPSSLDCSDPGTYRAELRQRLGVLPEPFHRLIVKALSFKPIGQVRQFVFDYLLDPRPVDTAALQSNLEHYKRLEGEARQAKARLDALERIVREGERIQAEERVAESHRFMELRADLESAEEAHRSTETEIAAKESATAENIAKVEILEDEIRAFASERDRVLGALDRHDVYRQVRELERELEQVVRDRDAAKDADVRARKLLKEQNAALERLLSEGARALRRRRPELLETDDLVGAEEPPAIVARLRETLAVEGALAGRDLTTWTRRLDRAAETLQGARYKVQAQLDEAKEEGRTLDAEHRALEEGRQRYPDGVEALLHLLTSKLHGKREPKPLCELVEIPDERWRDAVEGYLHTRRFDVIVAPDDYPRALSLYEKNKHDYPLPKRGRVFISGVGLVDIEKLQRQGARVELRSLAEQVSTDDPLARLYCDYVLGDVVCVDDEQSLRKHRAAITDTVMVYRNHVARQTSRDVYARHYIGQAARLRRLGEIARRLAEISELVPSLAGDLEWIQESVAIVDRARADARLLPDLVERGAARTSLEARAKRLEEQRAQIDRSEIGELERLRDELFKQHAKASGERDRARDLIAGAARDLERLRADLTQRSTEMAEAGAALSTFRGALEPSSLEGYEQKYVRDRVARKPREIHEVYERQRKGIESRIVNWIQDLIVVKKEYVDKWGLVADVRGGGFAEFASERDLWKESRLPEYEEKIGAAKKLALEQLAEDVVFKLRDNLIQARRELDELNRALKDVPFGSDRYQFTLDVDREHKDFYDLVMNAGMFEKESLFGSTALNAPEARTTLQTLLDRLVDAEATQVKTELEARADYREYFRYDLKIIHESGQYSLYDRVSGDKSGGETQTPYYIAILASMYRMYRSGKGALDGKPTCGVVLLDEAFGKMDESRISATLKFSRELGLQLLLATPKERSDLVAPKVERAIYVHKDALSGEPTLFDVTKEFAKDEPQIADSDSESETGDPDDATRRLRT